MSIKCHHDNQSFRQKSYAAVRLLLEDDQNVLSLSGFMKMFADTYNHVMDEQSIVTMKHAIEVRKKTWDKKKSNIYINTWY